MTPEIPHNYQESAEWRAESRAEERTARETKPISPFAQALKDALLYGEPKDMKCSEAETDANALVAKRSRRMEPIEPDGPIEPSAA
jgi:hypothetical protein